MSVLEPCCFGILGYRGRTGRIPAVPDLMVGVVDFAEPPVVPYSHIPAVVRSTYIPRARPLPRARVHRRVPAVGLSSGYPLTLVTTGRKATGCLITEIEASVATACPLLENDGWAILTFRDDVDRSLVHGLDGLLLQNNGIITE